MLNVKLPEGKSFFLVGSQCLELQLSIFRQPYASEDGYVPMKIWPLGGIGCFPLIFDCWSSHIP